MLEDDVTILLQGLTSLRGKRKADELTDWAREFFEKMEIGILFDVFF